MSGVPAGRAGPSAPRGIQCVNVVSGGANRVCSGDRHEVPVDGRIC